jgi:hypothetical protein
MKALFMSVLLVLSAKALAADTGAITYKSTATTSTNNLSNDVSARDTARISTSAADLDLDTDEIKYNSTEAGFQYSSINNGSAFAHIAIIHEFKNGFSIGARGLMPMNYTSDSQIYQGQAFGRFIILNEITQMHIEPSITQVIVSDDAGTHPIPMFGAAYGISRIIKNNLAVGGQIGVDFAGDRIAHNEIRSGTSTIYNRLSVNGTYAF